MLSQLLISASAFALGLFATPLARSVAKRFKIFDQPASRKVHSKPVPLLGGVAIYGAVLVSLLVFTDGIFVSQLVIPLLGATIIAALGLWDDRMGLGAVFRFSVQAVVALGVIFAGIHIDLFRQPILDYSISLFWILGVTNAFNLMDNMDGLTAGIGGIAALFFSIFSLLTGQYVVGAISAAVFGSCAAFLVFNFHPASIFMGDTGSLFIGFLLSLIAIKLDPIHTPNGMAWVIPILVLGLVLFDTTLVVFSRIRRGIPILQGGKDHFSHRLASLGLGARQVASLLYGLSIVLGLLALLVYQPAFGYGPLVAVLVFVVGAVTLAACEWKCRV